MKATVEHILSVGQAAPILGEWDELVDRTADFHYSQTAVYGAVAIEQALKLGSEVYLVLAREAQRLVAIWPFAVRREGLTRVARPLSCGSHEEYGDPLVATAADASAYEAVLSAATALPCDILKMTNVKPGAFAASLLDRGRPGSRGGHHHSMIGHAINLRQFANWEDYAAQASATNFAWLRRKWRRLERLGAVEMGWCQTPQDAADVLQWIFANKQRWAADRALYTPWLISDHVRRFFVALTQTVELKHHPIVTFIKLNGRPIAAQINLLGSQSWESFIICHDESHNRYSPGEILTKYGIKLAIQRNLDFDLRILSNKYNVEHSDRLTPCDTYEVYITRLGQSLAPLQARLRGLRNRAVQGLMRIRNAVLARGGMGPGERRGIPANARPILKFATIGLIASATAYAVAWAQYDHANSGIPGYTLWRKWSGKAHGGRYAQVNGVRLYYETYGAGPPVLVLHGGFADHKSLHYQIVDLASDHLVIAPDSRGHGRSTDGVGPLHYASMADDMTGLMDQLHIAKADVVGWSDGGVVGLDMAMRRPERIGRVVAMGANFDVSGMAYPVAARSADDPALAAARNFYLHASPTPAHWPAFYAEVIQMWRTEPHYSLDDLHRIRSPVLLISGEHDAVRRDHTDALARAIPNASEVIIPGAGHTAPILQPAAVNAAIRGFLAAAEPTPKSG